MPASNIINAANTIMSRSIKLRDGVLDGSLNEDTDPRSFIFGRNAPADLRNPFDDPRYIKDDLTPFTRQTGIPSAPIGPFKNPLDAPKAIPTGPRAMFFDHTNTLAIGKAATAAMPPSVAGSLDPRVVARPSAAESLAQDMIVPGLKLSDSRASPPTPSLSDIQSRRGRGIDFVPQRFPSSSASRTSLRSSVPGPFFRCYSKYKGNNFIPGYVYNASISHIDSKKARSQCTTVKYVKGAHIYPTDPFGRVPSTNYHPQTAHGRIPGFPLNAQATIFQPRAGDRPLSYKSPFAVNAGEGLL
jgi:hypothetical protein